MDSVRGFLLEKWCYNYTNNRYLASWEQVDDNLIKNKVNQGFNLNEFPSLGGGVGNTAINSAPDSSGNNAANDAAVRAHLLKLQQLQNQDLTNQLQQQPSGIPPPGLQNVPNSSSMSIPQLNSIPSQTNIITNNANANNNTTNNKPKQKPEEELTDMDRFGLNGLLGLLRNENNDQSTTAIGTDLNILGLDMSENSIDIKLSKTFPSPWIETSRSEVEPQYQIKDFLKIEKIPDISEKLSLFSDETLFYIFYSRTRDVLQELSARVLTQRNWRYHKELQVWLTKDSNTEPIQQSPQSERGLYIFFDPHNWEKVRKEFILYYQSIMTPA
ncbi:CCR4-NOT transcription complex subunit 2 [Wickerhamomyces ciferrii]|uniref:CCR4-NOT transcription complex subunit 2 n=1 Tax=Wickerhamomyces ciferrii (strain ATCC 14091 / BCRC 22168 / CBS 111 / JCM 3599 / NBRC 0793 / NRRL Y-1031 F-60-10) TaxID=1206466 RepID=K0KGN5_WICCF|nr:CCR4-NOT transcription complex subunit 2 [Wickerhamomyces ciferrii]CCH41342.1 CCR4-NOT transcription complex subunit 2 [Wickerhamomyces ciferrii]